MEGNPTNPDTIINDRVDWLTFTILELGTQLRLLKLKQTSIQSASCDIHAYIGTENKDDIDIKIPM